MRLLVTAGPTREMLDPVRFISNRSTGKMGYAVAESGVEHGHEVCLVSGPVSLRPPAGVDLVRVTSAAEMAAAVGGRVANCDALIMAAAVSDWRPKVRSETKIGKTGSGLVLELEPTEDILAGLAGGKGSRIHVGFAAQTGNPVDQAARKLAAKRLDLIVANDVSVEGAGFESDTNIVALVFADGRTEELPLMSKRAVADRIVEWVERRLDGRER